MNVHRSDVPHRPDVLLVIDSFHLGGTETFATRALEALRDAGVRVQVACFRPEGPLFARASAAAEAVHSVSVPAGPLRVVGMARALRSLVRELQPRTVYAQDVYSNYLSALALVGISGVRLVTSRRWARTPSRARRTLAMWAARRSDCVVVNSEVLSRVVRSEGVPAERVVLVPNIVEQAMFARATEHERAAWRVSHGIASGAIVMMVAGRLHPDKGPDIALEAFALLPAELRSRLVLVFYGDGELLKSLESRTVELGLVPAVRFLGAFVTPPNVFRMADLVVLPSRSEGMPNSLLEAAAVGVPGVATDVGGVRDFAAITEAYLICEPNSQASLADAMIQFFSSAGAEIPFHAGASRYMQGVHSPCSVSRGLAPVLDVRLAALRTPHDAGAVFP